MKVMFSKSDDGRLCSWRAELPRHGRFQGSTMTVRAGHTDLPHDLAQFVVEAALGLEEGFWNLVANGASFKSIERRRTKPGRQLIADHRAELNEVEEIVNVHVAAWRDGDPTPVGPALDAMLARWWSSGRRGGSQGPRSGSEERRRSGVRGGSAGPDLD
jgi:hypothetical protein